MEYEYYDKETDKTYSYEEALEILEERYAINFDYTKDIEQTNKQFEAIDVLLTNLFEICEKQPKIYERDGVMVCNYTC